MPKHASLKERFLEKVNASGDCWIWSGSRHPDGYGKMGFENKYFYSHRFAYELYVGKIPNGLCVLHKCDNPPCVNPEHLFLGTNADNTRDKLKKGRQARGDKHGSAKLSINDVRGIFAALHFGFDGQSVARIFGVSKSTVSAIKAGTLWKHIQLGEQ